MEENKAGGKIVVLAGCKRDWNNPEKTGRTSMKMTQRAPLRDVTRKPHLMPASDRDADIWEHIKRVVQTCYHPTSTCAIGSVVDPELRVFGVDGLRVVDASVMPSVIRGNTNAPTIMIAEKASDMLRGSVH